MTTNFNTDFPPKPEPVVAVPLAEWETANFIAGFWEGVWMSIKSELNSEIVQNIDARYAEIMKEQK